MTTTDTIRAALAHGRADAAYHGAAELMRGSDPRKAAHDIGTVLARLYADFHVAAVHEFCESFVNQLPEEFANLLEAPFRADLELTALWNRRLAELAGERLANDLVEAVKGNEMARAEEAVRLLVGLAEKPEQRTDRARQVGNILGGLLYEKDRASALVRAVSRAPQKFDLDALAATDMEEEFQRAGVAAVRRERPSVAGTRVELTQATVELSRSLPGRMAIHDPNPEDYESFTAQMRAIIRCCLLSPAHHKFHEATQLFVEFSPKELSATGALAGVEQRLFITLGRTARTVAAKVLGDLGANPRVFDPYFAFAQARSTGRIGPLAVETLGLLGNPECTEWLVKIAADRKHAAHAEAVFALGSIGGPLAEKSLLRGLEVSVSGRVIEGEMRREAVSHIAALGRLARPLDPTTRSQLIAHVMKAVPIKDTELVIRSVLAFFQGPLETYAAPQLNWAAQVATAALWTIDRPELARAARNAPLGFRQPLLDLLERLAPHALPAINQAALTHAKSWGGAYLALGEFYGKNPDPSALPVLRQMLLNTFLHDDTPRSAYNREMVMDVATEQKVELRKDQVLASLIYAVDKIDTEESAECLGDLFEQVQAGRLPRPGREAADILFQSHMKSGKGRAMMKQALPRGDAADPGEMPGLDDPTPSSVAVSPVAVSADDLTLIKDLQGSYLLSSKRRAKKVAAMAGLAQRKVVAALPDIAAHLTDKDNIVAAAAATALVDYGSPPVPSNVLNHLHAELLKVLESGPDPAKAKLTDILSRLNPAPPPLKDPLIALSRNTHQNMAAKSVLARLIQPSGVQPQAQPDKPAGEPGSGGFATPAPTAHNVALTRMDRMRAFTLARQEWIRGGKRGPEPQPPE